MLAYFPQLFCCSWLLKGKLLKNCGPQTEKIDMEIYCCDGNGMSINHILSKGLLKLIINSAYYRFSFLVILIFNHIKLFCL